VVDGTARTYFESEETEMPRKKPAPKSVRRKRVKKGVAAAPKRFKGTRSEKIAGLLKKSREELSAEDAAKIRERLLTEIELGVKRGPR
jgi:hypothetical protein